MRISDWSSDVCSSDLQNPGKGRLHPAGYAVERRALVQPVQSRPLSRSPCRAMARARCPAIGSPPSPSGNAAAIPARDRSEEHTSELQSLMRISYAVFCLKKKKNKISHKIINHYIIAKYTHY